MMALRHEPFHSDVGVGVSKHMSASQRAYSLARQASTCNYITDTLRCTKKTTMVDIYKVL